MLASVTAIFVSNYAPPEPFNIALLIQLTAYGMVLAHVVYGYFFALMANGTYIPNFRNPKIVKLFRIWVLIFLAMFLGRLSLALYIAIALP